MTEDPSLLPWTSPGDRLSSPAALRNREPILAVLRQVLPPTGMVLEIAAGSGEHAAYFSAALPGLVWQPTEIDLACLASVSARVADAARSNLRPPVRLDVFDRPWLVADGDRFEAVVAINMIHIAPWPATLALIAGASAVLAPRGQLILYGPFRVDGVHTAPSNAAFDGTLKVMDPRFGVRDLSEVSAEAARCGLALEHVVPMPANNLTVTFRAAPGDDGGP